MGCRTGLTPPSMRRDARCSTSMSRVRRRRRSPPRAMNARAWIPQAGQVMRQGQVWYQTGNGSPVVLPFGSVPDWRTLDEGITGQDVSQLNHDLVNLGDAGRADIAALGWDYYSWETAYAVRRLEQRLGVSGPPGSMSLGQVVFESEALRGSRGTGSLGGPGSGPVLAATSDR